MSVSYNPVNNNTNNIAGATENKGLFYRTLRGLSSVGFNMNYNDMVSRNTVGIGINEDPLAQKNGVGYDFISTRAISKILDKKSIAYLDKSYADKRKILNEYAIKDGIRQCIDIIADECIVYNGKDFCSPRPLPISYSDEIRAKYHEYFEKIYNRFGFADGITAWSYMRDFLIDGYLGLEIIWDDKKQYIVGFNRLDPATLVVSFEPTVGYLWIQFPEDPSLRKILLDSQMIFISFTTRKDFSGTSYVEGLIRPYNQLKIVEQSRVMFNLMNATIHQVFTVPTRGMAQHKAEEQVGKLIANYSESVDWDDSLGTLTINGSKHIPYNKQIWLPDGEFGKPTMELVSPTGTDLNEDTTLKYFKNAFNEATRIAKNRLSNDGDGGNVFTLDNSEVNNDENKMNKFINRNRAIYREIVVKPWKLQMCMEFPELKDDEIFQNSIDIDFSSDQSIEQWKVLKSKAKKIETAVASQNWLKSDGTPVLHYLMSNKLFGVLTEVEMQENESYWIRDKAKGGAPAAGGEGGAPAAGGEGGAPPAGGGGGDSGGGGGSDEFNFDGGGGSGEEGGETPPAEGGETPPETEGGEEEKPAEFEF